MNARSRIEEYVDKVKTSQKLFPAAAPAHDGRRCAATERSRKNLQRCPVARTGKNFHDESHSFKDEGSTTQKISDLQELEYSDRDSLKVRLRGKLH